MVVPESAARIALIDCAHPDAVALVRRCTLLGMTAYATSLEDILVRRDVEGPHGLVVATSDAEIVQRIRRKTRAPLVVIDAAPAPGAAVRMLSSGADDHVRMPWDYDEIAARIAAVLRRAYRGPVTVYDLQFDPAARVVRRAGRTVALTPTESAILASLAEHRDTILSRDEVALLAARHGARLHARSVPVAVHHLRRKIDAGDCEPLIHCIPFAGYFFGRYREGLPRARAAARKARALP